LTTSEPKDGEIGAERRKSPRYPFVANAEVREASTDAKLNARVSEISLNGCYLDMVNPLPVGTAVVVKIFTVGEFFESAANVVYSHPNLGIGLMFHDVSVHFVPTLRKWLLEAMCTAKPGQKA
jgi:hypothetical protein